MRSLPLALTQELEAEVHFIGHLIRIVLFDVATQTDVPLYFTDRDMDIVYDAGEGAKTWLSRGIEFGDGQQSLTPKVDSISFEIDNTGLEFSYYVMSHETRGKECTIYKAALNASLQVLGAAVLFPGILDKVEVDSKRARFDVLNSFIRWNTPTPRRRHAASCFWTFKDTQTCRYTGSLTNCDKSWDNCILRMNTINFGGFRFMQSLSAGNKEIKWGPY